MFLGGNNAADVPSNAHTRAMESIPPDMRPLYVAYPPPDSPEVSRYMAKCCTQRAWARGDQNVAFIGQVPRLLPLQYIPWALDLLLEEYGTRWVLQTQPNGCAKAWVDDDAHCTTLTERSKTMLFDVCGLWVARTRGQVDAIMAYQATLQSQGPLDGRVPRHGMLAEKLRPPQGVLRKELHEREQHLRSQGVNPGTGAPLASGHLRGALSGRAVAGLRPPRVSTSSYHHHGWSDVAGGISSYPSAGRADGMHVPFQAATVDWSVPSLSGIDGSVYQREELSKAIPCAAAEFEKFCQKHGADIPSPADGAEAEAASEAAGRRVAGAVETTPARLVAATPSPKLTNRQLSATSGCRVQACIECPASVTLCILNI